MTSPAITKSPENQKNDKKSPTHSVSGAGAKMDAARIETPSSETPSTSAITPSLQTKLFGWMRVFKFADLMMKQGC